MITLGLTGGVGMGKSTAALFLAERGWPIVDTDQLARDLVQPGSPALQEIQARFGAAILDPSGQLRRSALADIVFRDDHARHDLERILHPRIRAAWQQQRDRHRDAGSPACLVVIPLLFETHAEPEFDRIVCVACSQPTQLDRLHARGWSDAQIADRCRAQWPVDRKLDAAHVVLWNEGSLQSLRRQCDLIERPE